uniref:NmrA-like domain-containing protein n=1 Tax=Polysiphonia sertularioides TaxID=945028 RepID=A0A1Z1MGS1_9FLOR|nr:hypothetical protein [Polysiphonia sertularioides]
MTLLIIGSTGTLGRQVVRKALNEGFQVKCLVRNFRKAAFLKEWGAELIYGDLVIPETIPLALLDATAIIDCSTGRSQDNSYNELIDLNSKYILIESAIKSNIKRFIFFSIINSASYNNIKVMTLKNMVESRLKKSKLSFTVFYLPGFFQGLIGQYALPILDKQSVWVTSEESKVSYISTQDIASIAIKSLSIKQFQNRSLDIGGLGYWQSRDIIELCERVSGRRADTKKVPVYLLTLIQIFVRLFKWTRNIEERLAFTQLLSKNYCANVNMKEILYILRINQNQIESLEAYLQEYFNRVMKKVKELNYQNLTNNDSTKKIEF